MMPSKAMAAVASSALRNYKIKRLSWGDVLGIIDTYFDKGIALFVVHLDSENRITRCASSDTHFLHLRVEE